MFKIGEKTVTTKSHIGVWKGKVCAIPKDAEVVIGYRFENQVSGKFAYTIVDPVSKVEIRMVEEI